MLFTEKKVGDIYKYKNEDFYGSLDIESTVPLEADSLDTIVLKLMHYGSHEGTIGENITYTLTRATPWLEDNNDEHETS